MLKYILKYMSHLLIIGAYDEDIMNIVFSYNF